MLNLRSKPIGSKWPGPVPGDISWAATAAVAVATTGSGPGGVVGPLSPPPLPPQAANKADSVIAALTVKRVVRGMGVMGK
jgi:hypothetical protein